jgi:hypothetical protein
MSCTVPCYERRCLLYYAGFVCDDDHEDFVVVVVVGGSAAGTASLQVVQLSSKSVAVVVHLSHLLSFSKQLLLASKVNACSVDMRRSQLESTDDNAPWWRRRLGHFCKLIRDARVRSTRRGSILAEPGKVRKIDGFPPGYAHAAEHPEEGAFYYKFESVSPGDLVYIESMAREWHEETYDTDWDVDCRNRNASLAYLKFFFGVRL